MARLSVNLNGWVLKNPLIPASGTFGYGLDYQDFFDVNILGSLSIKGTTLHPRFGNETPRIAECEGGMLNSVGLQNPGVEEVVTHLLPELATHFHEKVLANVSGFSIEEYVECAKRMDQCSNVGLIELNISCPNAHGGGMSFGVNIADALAVVAAVKKVITKPMYVKCTPQCSNLKQMCIELEKAGVDGIVLMNTYLGMRLDYQTGKPILANITGGVSGKGVFPMVVQQVYSISQVINIPIIACGGISSAKDVIEVMSAGASAVEIGTAGLIDPMVYPTIIKELEECLDELKIENIQEIIGRSYHE